MAWKAGWNPSFDGWAIVNQDFTFRSVNPQFCELLGVTPAQLVGQRFQDITATEMRKLDEANAMLVMQGAMDFYVMRKTYDFGGGNRRNVVLLVCRVPKSGDGVFRFFLSRIMLDAELPSIPSQEQDSTPLPIISPLPSSTGDSGNILKFFAEFHKPLIIIGTVAAAFVVALLKLIGIL